MEEKLVSLGKIEGIVAGQFGEDSEATHRLVAALATSRVRVAGPTRGRRGLVRTEEVERSVAVASIRRRFGVMTVRCQPVASLAVWRPWALEVQLRWEGESRLEPWSGGGRGKPGQTSLQQSMGGGPFALVLQRLIRYLI